MHTGLLHRINQLKSRVAEDEHDQGQQVENIENVKDIDCRRLQYLRRDQETHSQSHLMNQARPLRKRLQIRRGSDERVLDGIHLFFNP